MLKNVIFIDQSAANFYTYVSLMTCECAQAKLLAHFPPDSAQVVWAKTDSVQEVIDQISDMKQNDELLNYVIVTGDVLRYSNANTNNVFPVNQEIATLASRIKWAFHNYSKPTNPDQVYFTSDTHFNHENIIKYCNRPYQNASEMNEDLIVRWNAVVPENAIVYHLGDFALGNRKKTIPEILPRLHGKIHLVLGNHDTGDGKKATDLVKFYTDMGFARVYDKPIVIDGFWILSHTPLEFLNDKSPMASIFGHVHDSDMYKTYSKNSCCVCVERHNYAPISFTEIKNKIRELNHEEENT